MSICSRSTLCRNLSVILVISLLALAGCDQSPVTESSDPDDTAELSAQSAQIQAAIRAQEKHGDDFIDRPGIVGVGSGVDAEGKANLVIYATNSKMAEKANLPSHANGVPLRVEITGLIVAGSDPQTRARPAPVGFSMGHPNITAGTYGVRVKDGSGNVYALSNNHVLADANEASIGDNILQPGPADGGTNPDDKIGELADYEPIDFSGTNVMDAAVAISSTANLDFSTPSDAYGVPGTEPTSAAVGLNVQKYGRTTQLTKGEVSETNVTVDVCYETAGPFRCKQSARFEDQIGVTPGSFSDGGDSGLLIVTDDSNKNPVGLLFAGSDTRTLANPISPVLTRFSVSVDDGSGDSGDTNSSPTASFTHSCTDLSCDFDGSGSSDSDGSISSYDWDFGDGATGSGQTVSHTYGSGGTYTVTLTVTDDDGATDSASQDVSVSSSTSSAPTVDGLSLSEDNSGGSPHADFDVSWSVSDSDGDLDAVDLTLYELDSSGNRVATEESASVDVSGSSASGTTNLKAKHDENSQKTYEVELTVTDASGNTASSTATEVEDGS